MRPERPQSGENKRTTRGQVGSKISSAENINYPDPSLINSREKIKASVIR